MQATGSPSDGGRIRCASGVTSPLARISGHKPLNLPSGQNRMCCAIGACLVCRHGVFRFSYLFALFVKTKIFIALEIVLKNQPSWLKIKELYKI